MTTSLDAYRSDREQLLARVRELEAEVEQLENEIKTLKQDRKTPLDWLLKCPVCGCAESSWGKEQEQEKNKWVAARYPKACTEKHRSWFFIATTQTAHAHQSCTACGAHWIVDAKGWRFD